MSSIIYYSHKLLLLKSQYLINNNKNLSCINLSNKKFFILILITNLLIKCCAATAMNGGVAGQQSSLGIYMISQPESTIAPQGDEVQFECELSLEPDKIEWKFRPQDSPKDKDSFVNVNRNVSRFIDCN